MLTIDLLPPGLLDAAFREDARAGLTATPKSLPSKWFYDAKGDALFKRITELPEYYLARAERAILSAAASRIAEFTEARAVVELGLGSTDKTRLLLDALRSRGTLRSYVGVDVSESAIAAAGHVLCAGYPGLVIRGVVADFDEHLGLPGYPASGPSLVVSLGSVFGNMVPPQRAAFLSKVRSRLRPGDAFLLGVDLVKDPAVLVAAYDDSAGVTAAFNRNILTVLNTRLAADFDVEAFDHVAVWVPETEWVEMRLRSAADQQVRLPGAGLTVGFAAGEEMRTEIAAKFRRDGVDRELAACGLKPRAWWTDAPGQFAVSLSVPV